LGFAFPPHIRPEFVHGNAGHCLDGSRPIGRATSPSRYRLALDADAAGEFCGAPDGIDCPLQGRVARCLFSVHAATIAENPNMSMMDCARLA
jgi:hypothetical protein